MTDLEAIAAGAARFALAEPVTLEDMTEIYRALKELAPDRRVDVCRHRAPGPVSITVGAASGAIEVA